MAPQNTLRDMLHISAGVAAALAAGQPVVALESTIITQGMPWPQNLEMAQSVEAIVRASGALPATIAVLGGRMVVGLCADGLAQLAASKHAAKASRRDLAAVIAKGLDAGTTVAATMFIAAAAGIAVFATGGIGGVHRGAESTFDISADLKELATSPVAVVCAGAKSILDIAKTLEFLETQGVPVYVYGSDDFPAFYARRSGCRADHRFDSAADLARAIRAQQAIGPGGVLIANPIPQADAIDGAEIEARIAQACDEAQAQGIGQKELTPFLLARINALTAGKSLAANMALVRNNAALAARVAVELARL